MNLCQNPELACEVTLQPLDRFPLDAAILFSDILTIPDAMGLGCTLKKEKGHAFSTRLPMKQALQNLLYPIRMMNYATLPMQYH